MISIQIVTYNSQDTIEACIASLFDCLIYDFEIIIFDNASIDQTITVVTGLIKKYPRIKLVESKVNIGFGAGHNAAASHAHGDKILILNPDTVLVDVSDSKIFDQAWNKIIGFKFTYRDGSLQYTIGRDPTLLRIIADRIPVIRKYYGIKVRTKKSYETAHPVDWVHGCGMLVSAESFKKLGGFDESFFMYCEDIDLCMRAKENGAVVQYDPALTFIHHKEGMRKDKRPAKYYRIRKGLFSILKKDGNNTIARYRILLRLETSLMLVRNATSSEFQKWRSAVKDTLAL